MTNSQTYNQISSLPDEDVVIIFATSAKVLKERGLYAETKKAFKKVTSNKKPQEHKTPYIFNRGKVKRVESHSILLDFLSEDWGFLFDGEYDEDKKYYVYYHSDPTMPNMRLRKNDNHIEFKGRPFYIGKGTGERFKNLHRSRSHLSRINDLKKQGISEDSIFHIFKDNLTEKEALELESKLITFFGCANEVSRNKTHFHGMKGGLLVNSDPGLRPFDVDQMVRRGR